MARWQPDTRERLQNAALELFEHGYDNTTAAEIAERAGTAKSTFFRHFSDKREVLFVGTGAVADCAVAAIVAVPDDTPAFTLVESVVGAVIQEFDPAQRAWYGRRQAVIDQTPELRERDLLKRQSQAEAMTAALREHGESGLAPEVVAALIGLALHTTYTCWIEADDDRDVAAIAADVLADLRATVSALK
jgi:AcrR family transcriptional regulator